MTIPLLIGIVLCLGLFLYTKKIERDNKRKHEDVIVKLRYGARIRTMSGLSGAVTDIEDAFIRADLSPDRSGSVVEISKDSIYEIIE